jgi:hypothetical protein
VDALAARIATRAALVTPPEYTSMPISFRPKPRGLDVEN